MSEPQDALRVGEPSGLNEACVEDAGPTVMITTAPSGAELDVSDVRQLVGWLADWLVAQEPCVPRRAPEAA